MASDITSLCFEEGVLELDEMLECGECEGYSFLMVIAFSPFPFSLGDELPLAPLPLLLLELPFTLQFSSLATSTTNSWSLFSPSLSCKYRAYHV